MKENLSSTQPPMAYYPPNPIVTIQTLPTRDPWTQLNYSVAFHSQRVRTTVTTKASVVSRWVQFTNRFHKFHLRKGRLIVGLGIQWAPSKDHSDSQPSAATLQLCVGHNCLIFQLAQSIAASPLLRQFLSSPNITFVGITDPRAGDMLRDSRHRLQLTRLVDVRRLAWWYLGCDPMLSMGKLAEEVLGMDGVEIDVAVGRSRGWDAASLSADQVMYACVDAFVAFAVGLKLRAWMWGRR